MDSALTTSSSLCSLPLVYPIYTGFGSPLQLRVHPWFLLFWASPVSPQEPLSPPQSESRNNKNNHIEWLFRFWILMRMLTFAWLKKEGSGVRGPANTTLSLAPQSCFLPGPLCWGLQCCFILFFTWLLLGNAWRTSFYCLIFPDFFLKEFAVRQIHSSIWI